ncbi:hypothetical protein [Streptosporangium sandarakinum]
MTVIRIISVRTGTEVSRAVLADDGTVSYGGGESAAYAVRSWIRQHGGTEADAVHGLAREGWSNGYLMVDLGEQP